MSRSMERNSRIVGFNIWLRDLCKKKKLHFMDNRELFAGLEPQGVVYRCAGSFAAQSLDSFTSLFLQENRTHIYFLDEGDDIPLKGPDNPGNGPVVWEWKPHSGQAIQRLVTFHKGSLGRWVARWNHWTEAIKDLYNKAFQDGDFINLKIKTPTFKLAGLLILTQTQPSNKILKLYELFGIKVESSPQSAVVGSDVTLSCTISKLSDTVSLQWKQRDSSQQNRRNTGQIRINNTVYLIVRHVAVEDEGLYACEVQENGSIILTGKADFYVSKYLYQKSYTLYRSGTDHSELDLICSAVSTTYNAAAWTWSSHHLQNQEKNIATASKSQPIDVNRTYFASRLVPTVGYFNGDKFSVRIVPVLFDDAGVYTCYLESSTYVTIKLITVKVTAEPYDAVTEGDNVTLTCSVSDVTESMRLVWISSDGKTVGEKTLNGQNGEEKSLRLIIQKADRGRGNWICALFYQNRPQILVPYYLEPSVETDSQRPVMGSDVTLSCTISRLSATVSLHWKPRDSPQQDRRNNADDLHLNNTVYLIIRHVGAEIQNLYTWEVQENDSIVLTGNTNVDVDQNLFNKIYILYRSDTDHSELDLICEALSEYNETKWTWRSRQFQNQEKEIASTFRSKPIDVNRTYFGSRLVPTVGNYNGKNFNVRIVPVLFDDAGVYTCSLGTHNYVTIKLITVKVTAEPSDAVTEGDTVTLTCSVSDVPESMRLVWINSDGKTVGEKIFKDQKQEEDLLRLIIQKANRDRRNWTCVLFHQNSPKILIPYYLKFDNDYTFKHTTVVILGSLALLFIIILAVVLCLRKRKVSGLGNQRQKPLQPGENKDDASQLYSNANEIQQMQGENDTTVPETSSFAEYANVNIKAKEDDTEREDIHYGSISFQKKNPGSRHGTQCNKQSSDTNLAPSKEDDSSVIYAKIAQAK
uniref:obscurin-like n=1 Tax=Pristiophorus japonicus TaxID=55135 RepID=UPI00398EA22C